MGQLNHDQQQLFYSFRLDEAVPHDHPVREIAAVLDLSWVHSELAPFYPKMGRPSIDPELERSFGLSLDSVPLAQRLGYEIVNNVSFFSGHAPKHYSFIRLTEHSLSNVHQRLPHHRTPRFLAPLRPQR
jgi:hypothetical protein